MYAIYVLLGLFVGFLSGLFGIGGGLVVVPVLTFLFQYLDIPESFRVQTAVGTSLAAMIFTSSSSAISHYMQNGINWKVFKILVPGLILGAISGALIANYLPGQTIKWIFAVFVLSVGFKFIFRPKVDWHTNLPHWMLAPIAFLLGNISTILGVGGGFITVPILTSFRLHMTQAISISAITGFIMALVGTISFFLIGSRYEDSSDLIGYIYLPAAVTIGLSAFMVAPIGAKMAYRLPVEDLKKYFGLLLLVMGFLILLEA